MYEAQYLSYRHSLDRIREITSCRAACLQRLPATYPGDQSLSFTIHRDMTTRLQLRLSSSSDAIYIDTHAVAAKRVSTYWNFCKTPRHPTPTQLNV